MEAVEDIAIAMLSAVDVPVIRGVVTELATAIRGHTVWTTYRVVVEEVLRGDPAEIVTVTLPGGVFGSQVQRATGWPLWKAGDDVLVFVPPLGTVPAQAAWRIGDGSRLTDHLMLVDVEEALRGG